MLLLYYGNKSAKMLAYVTTVWSMCVNKLFAVEFVHLKVCIIIMYIL